jgi:hypothetical protein
MAEFTFRTMPALRALERRCQNDGAIVARCRFERVAIYSVAKLSRRFATGPSSLCAFTD